MFRSLGFIGLSKYRQLLNGLLGVSLDFVCILKKTRSLRDGIGHPKRHLATGWKRKITLIIANRRIAKALFVILFAAMSIFSPNAFAQPTGLFGSREIHSTNMKSFDKWSGVWRRQNLAQTEEASLETETVNPNNQCRGVKRRIKCNREAWDSFINSQRTGEQVSEGGDNPDLSIELLSAVNLYINRTKYIVDPVNWGVPDYWSTPDEFFLRSGDCEDYAISKFITLKRLGVDTAKMRIAVVQDENLRAAHAVLAVELEGIFHILDNQVDSVLAHSEILHYRPVYSINEAGWWLHQVRRFGR